VFFVSRINDWPALRLAPCVPWAEPVDPAGLAYAGT